MHAYGKAIRRQHVQVHHLRACASTTSAEFRTLKNPGFFNALICSISNVCHVIVHACTSRSRHRKIQDFSIVCHAQLHACMRDRACMHMPHTQHFDYKTARANKFQCPLDCSAVACTCTRCTIEAHRSSDAFWEPFSIAAKSTKNPRVQFDMREFRRFFTKLARFWVRYALI